MDLLFGSPFSNYHYQPRYAERQPPRFAEGSSFFRPYYEDEQPKSYYSLPNAYAGQQRSSWDDFPWQPSVFRSSPCGNYSATPSFIRRGRNPSRKSAKNSQVEQRQERENLNSGQSRSASDRAVIEDSTDHGLQTSSSDAYVADERLTSSGVSEELDHSHSDKEECCSSTEVELTEANTEEVHRPDEQTTWITDELEGVKAQQQEQDKKNEEKVSVSDADIQVEQHTVEGSNDCFHCGTEDSETSPKHEAPNTTQKMDEMSAIEKLLNGTSELLSAVDMFDGSSADKQYLILSERLMSILLKLDLIDTHGNTELRRARRDAVRTIQGALQVLDSKCSH